LLLTERLLVFAVLLLWPARGRLAAASRFGSLRGRFSSWFCVRSVPLGVFFTLPQATRKSGNIKLAASLLTVRFIEGRGTADGGDAASIFAKTSFAYSAVKPKE